MGNKSVNSIYTVWFIEESPDLLKDKTKLYIDPDTDFAKRLLDIKNKLKKSINNYITDETHIRMIQGKVSDFFVELIDEPNVEKLTVEKLVCMKKVYDIARYRFSFSKDGKTLLFHLYESVNNKEINITFLRFKDAINIKKREIILDKLLT